MADASWIKVAIEFGRRADDMESAKKDCTYPVCTVYEAEPAYIWDVAILPGCCSVHFVFACYDLRPSNSMVIAAKNISKYLFLSLSLASFHNPQAASEAFSPPHSSLGLNKQRESNQDLVSLREHRKLKPFVLMSQVEGVVEEGITEIPVRGGGQSEMKKLFREMIAELIGTLIIVQIGTASVMSAIFTDSLNLFGIASTWLIAVTLAISTTADVSGAHLNPAISIAFALLRPS
eukprot:scaffold22641_cov206-Cylindrotheca_fusiformis.AAC.15